MEICWLYNVIPGLISGSISAIIGALIGYKSCMAGAKKARDLSRNDVVSDQKLILLNQLQYSVDLYTGNTDEYKDLQYFRVISAHTLVIEEGYRGTLKYLNLNTTEKKHVMEWMRCIEKSEEILEKMPNERVVNVTFWKDYNASLGDIMDDLLQPIKDIIDKLNDEK